MLTWSDSYYDPPEPTPERLACLLCGGRMTDEDLEIDSLDECTTVDGKDSDFSTVACSICGEAGGLTFEWMFTTDKEWAAICGMDEPVIDEGEDLIDWDKVPY